MAVCTTRGRGPVLQHYNRAVEFVPILVPYMSFARMNELAPQLARAIASIIDDGLAAGNWARCPLQFLSGIYTASHASAKRK